MDDEQLALAQQERAARLAACEARIREAFRSGLAARRACGKELITIDTEKLYDVRGFASLKPYVEEHLMMDLSTAKGIISSYHTFVALEGAGLALPANEAQVDALSKVKQDRVPIVWGRLIRVSDKRDEPITVSAIRKAVNLDEPEEEEKPASKTRPGVRATITLDDDQTFHLELSENGERALARIRRICGEQVAQAIEAGILQLPERALIRWADENDDVMRNLVHYVVDLRWRVTDAITYDAKIPTGTTTLDTLITLARARRGHATIVHEEFRVLIERLAEAA